MYRGSEENVEYNIRKLFSETDFFRKLFPEISEFSEACASLSNNLKENETLEFRINLLNGGASNPRSSPMITAYLKRGNHQMDLLTYVSGESILIEYPSTNLKNFNPDLHLKYARNWMDSL